jgi:diguanylate cyclase (GGDEF)-like protein
VSRAERPDDPLQAARSTLLMLNNQCAVLREELRRLQEELQHSLLLADVDRLTQLQKANEHLLLASLSADQVAQSALAEVDLLLRRNQLDVLTETPNRSLLLDRLRVAIAHARRDGRRVAVLFIDLDHFKEINDTLGHAMGDEVLRRVARCLEAQLRETDTVSRHGGDEFLVVLADLEDPAGIRLAADKLLAALASPCEIAGHHMTLSASMGVAVYPEDGDEAAVLIHAADTAMYLNKRRRHQADPVPR